MRPDRAVVVAHRVERRLGAAQRANAPAAQHVLAHQARRRRPRLDRRRACRSRGSGPTFDATVVTRPLLGVERHRVELVDASTTSALKALPQVGRRLARSAAARSGSPYSSNRSAAAIQAAKTYPWTSASAIGGSAPCARRGGWLSRPSPSSPGCGCRASSDTGTRRSRRRRGRRTRSIQAQRGFEVRAQVGRELAVAGPADVLAERHDPERRRVDAAVVRAVRHVARARQARRAGSRAGSCLAARRASRSPRGPGARPGSSSVARAMSGWSASVWSDVIRLSRPNGTLNQGMPADGR